MSFLQNEICCFSLFTSVLKRQLFPFPKYSFYEAEMSITTFWFYSEQNIILKQEKNYVDKIPLKTIKELYIKIKSC